MTKVRFILPIAIVVYTTLATQAQSRIAITDQGWTITADPESAVLTVSQQALGPVLNEVRLNLRGSRGLVPLTKWSVAKGTRAQLTIKTSDPVGTWSFAFDPRYLKVSTTFTSGVVTATAPAPISRIPARILDSRGTPVDWVGTNEAMLEYGGGETRNQSYLPSRNPDVMYFALGLPAAEGFHTLFDRDLDIVMEFSDEALFRRSSDRGDRLNVIIPVPGNTTVRLIPDYYTKVLGAPSYVPFDDSYFNSAPMVWSSWTGYYGDVTEQDIIRNTDYLAKNLEPYGFQFVQLDDGYDRGKNGEHAWIGSWNKTKFPHGPEWLTGYIRSKGLRAGLWLVPNSYSEAVKEHPDWYVRTLDGELINDYSTPVLDSSNPEVLTFLRMLFNKLGKWGFEYYKFDGEGSIPQVMPELDRTKIYGNAVDPVASYRTRLEVIREAVGPHVFIEGCPAGMPLNGLGFFNSYFNGHDVYDNWQGMYPLFSSINGNAFLNHILAYVTPGEGLELRQPMNEAEAKKISVPGVLREISDRENPVTGVGVTDAEARTLVSLVSLTGVAYQVGSVMPGLPPERLSLLQKTLPTVPIIPLDLFSRGTEARVSTFRETRPDYYIHNYPEILDLKIASIAGTYDVVGLTNWRSESTVRRFSLSDKLGLPAGERHIVFDFWNQKLLGVVDDTLELDIDPHDTRVLSIHKILDRPQLIGNSRHITGAYSILDQGWDASTSAMYGTSQAVSGERYTLFFYVPEGNTVSKAIAATESKGPVAVQVKQDGNLLSLSFEGQNAPVSWKISFAN